MLSSKFDHNWGHHTSTHISREEIPDEKGKEGLKKKSPYAFTCIKLLINALDYDNYISKKGKHQFVVVVE